MRRATQALAAAGDVAHTDVVATVVIIGGKASEPCGLFPADAAYLGHS
jgi:hypothetical protein